LPRRAASTLVIGECAPGGSAPDAGTLSAVTAAAKLGAPVSLLLPASAASAGAALAGVSRVLSSSGEAVDRGLAEPLSAMVVALQKAHGFTHIVGVASNSGKNVVPRVAALLDVAAITEVTAIRDPATFDRPMYAGNAISTVKSADAVKVMTVRPTAFARAAPGGGGAAAPIEALPAAAAGGDRAAAFLAEERVKSERPELGGANVVVSGGRALKSADNFKLLYALADKMGAAVGASRAAVDAGYVPNDMQVGQTGKVVAPGLYIAVGISGAIQHMAGMKDSKVIVAVNKDADAPIMQVADFGLVEDLFTAVPEMTKKLA
jgi:electron transfer flavoprotein alpha subunit